jgi:transglutaminase-like putative cysteine protease
MTDSPATSPDRGPLITRRRALAALAVGATFPFYATPLLAQQRSHLSVRYVTRYRYSETVRNIRQTMRVWPRSSPTQTVLDWHIETRPPTALVEGRDEFGNLTHSLVLNEPMNATETIVTGRVLVEDRAGVMGTLADNASPSHFLVSTPLTRPGAAIGELVGSLSSRQASRLDLLHGLTQRLYAGMRFEVGATDVGTSAEAAYERRRGVCQDFTHIFIAAAHALGIPARYVSGHLFRRDGVATTTAAHAWAEAWHPDLGWIGFDPTNGISPDDAYIRVATGRDYLDAAPFTGWRAGGGRETLEVEVTVERLGSQR